MWFKIELVILVIVIIKLNKMNIVFFRFGKM